jgi:hypothetical protein
MIAETVAGYSNINSFGHDFFQIMVKIVSLEQPRVVMLNMKKVFDEP